ncbi:MarR family transcriptional regulator [Salinibaculum rarum]|uniref:MarR family transcriptional regulator n=1 Tax=Salinibaculum rarum TaxID=3058903 RepID=UPI00265E1E11|nr:MarR family transcriptional regulator [Salinibaculum sp. KK48]
MPISSDRFERISSDSSNGPSPGTNAAAILTFLREHPDQAFTQSEIATETAVKSGSVGPTLVRLRERGRVDHRGTYWRISDHDQSVDAATGHAVETLAERESDDETPSYEDWQEYAVDPRTSDDE